METTVSSEDKRFPAKPPMVFIDCGNQGEVCENLHLVRITDQRGVIYFGGLGENLVEAIRDLQQDVDTDKRSMPRGQKGTIQDLVSSALAVALRTPEGRQ